MQKNSYENTARTFKMPGRNEPCICGSGKKYKKCCLEKMGTNTSYTYNELQRMQAVMQAQEQVMKSEEENNDKV